MTAPDDITKALDEIELRFNQSVVTPDTLRDIALRMVVVARAADALWHHMEDGTDPCNGQETCPPMDRLRAALDALRGGEHG